MARVVFITATGTGEGKTVLAAHLLYGLRRSGVAALALKPFCSGGRADVRRLQSLQRRELTDEECNPYAFEAALAPGVAASQLGRRIPLASVLRHIRGIASRCEVLLVEGAGGVMAPAGTGFSMLELASALGGEVILVGRNRLGVINHGLLSLAALRRAGVREVTVVLMDGVRRDASWGSNAEWLRRQGVGAEVVTLPYFGSQPAGMKALGANSKNVKKVLARFFG